MRSLISRPTISVNKNSDHLGGPGVLRNAGGMPLQQLEGPREEGRPLLALSYCAQETYPPRCGLIQGRLSRCSVHPPRSLIDLSVCSRNCQTKNPAWKHICHWQTLKLKPVFGRAQPSAILNVSAPALCDCPLSRENRMIPFSSRAIALLILVVPSIQAQQAHFHKRRTTREISDSTKFQISKKISLETLYATGYEMGERHPVSLETAAIVYATGYGVGERHPVIHRAMRALEAAKAYMEAAPHDFCGHRVAALAESNLALNQLGLAIICDRRRDRTSRPGVPTAAPVSASDSLPQERHPLIRQAISSLDAA